MNVSFFLSVRFPVSGSGCKSRNPFRFLQAFLEVFFRKFSSPSFFPACRLFRWLSARAGRKGKPIFCFWQAFRKKILSPFLLFLPPLNLKNFAVIAGAKVHPFSASASIPAKFFYIFFHFCPKALEAWGLRREVFLVFLQKGKLGFGLCRAGHGSFVSDDGAFCHIRHLRAFKEDGWGAGFERGAARVAI